MSARPYCRSCKAHRAAGEAHTADCSRAQNVRPEHCGGAQDGPVSSSTATPAADGLATPTPKK